MLAHNVFFTLNDPSPAKVDELVAACRKYLNVQPGIVFFAAGPRNPNLTRDVNATDWHVGLTIVFTDQAAHDAYQDDPTHTRFIDEMKANWSAVRVYDSDV